MLWHSMYETVSAVRNWALDPDEDSSRKPSPASSLMTAKAPLELLALWTQPVVLVISVE
jgi:hypothetical protein